MQFGVNKHEYIFLKATKLHEPVRRELFVICTRVTTLHSCYMKNALVSSQSDASNFCMYIINPET